MGNRRSQEILTDRAPTVDLSYSDDFGVSSNTVIAKVKPGLELTAPGGYVTSGQGVMLSGSTSLPAGNEITIERRGGTAWTPIETGTVDEHGAFTAKVTIGTAGTFQYRAHYLSNGEWSDYANRCKTPTSETPPLVIVSSRWRGSRSIRCRIYHRATGSGRDCNGSAIDDRSRIGLRTPAGTAIAVKFATLHRVALAAYSSSQPRVCKVWSTL